MTRLAEARTPDECSLFSYSLALLDGLESCSTNETDVKYYLSEYLFFKHPCWRQKNKNVNEPVLSAQLSLHPDLSMLARSGGHPVLIETEYAPARTVERDAVKRLGHTVQKHGFLVERTMAVRLPIALKTSPQSTLHTVLRQSQFEYCIWSGSPKKPIRWPEKGWITANIDELADGIEHLCISESAITASLLELEHSVNQCAAIVEDYAKNTGEKIGELLCQEAGEQTLRMAMSILANALLFHTSITTEYDIPAVADFTTTDTTFQSSDLLKTWRHILENINYWPIFSLAHDILSLIPQRVASRVLLRMNRMLETLGPVGITTQNDLCGRMFQRLIADRKFLATFYTLPSSANLLAEIAISYIDIDWSNSTAVKNLRIADFACGTGALLTAAYRCAASRLRRAGLDDAEYHTTMVEKVLTGADIMPAATHLTASILSSAHPGVTFRGMNIVTMPYGEPQKGSGHSLSLGSLDLIDTDEALPLFGTGTKFLSGIAKQTNASKELAHESFDLVIMNPPFTRPTGHEASKIGVPVPSFAGFQTSSEEQHKMSNRLHEMYRNYLPKRDVDKVGTGQAGLASNFIDLAEAKLKTNSGIVALVLPATFVNGKAWTNARKLLLEHYDKVTLIAIASEGFRRQSFSADTSMAEVLVIGRKREPELVTQQRILYVNLYQRPDSILESSHIARQITQIAHSTNSGTLSIGDKEIGHFIRARSNDNLSGIRDLSVSKSGASLVCGILALPRLKTRFKLPLTRLKELGETGLYHMDLSGKELSKNGQPRGPFEIKNLSGNIPTFPCLWGHSAARETRMIVEPDTEGIARRGCDQRAINAWESTATRLHFNRDFGLASQPLAACLTVQKTLGGTAWPNFSCIDKAWEVPLVLWANTTLGLMLFWWIGTKQQPGRTRVSITTLPELPVIDPRTLGTHQLERLSGAFEEFKKLTFLPANEAYRDEARIRLDHFVLFEVLQLPKALADSLALLRHKWSNEPTVHGGKSTRPTSSRS